MQFFYIHTVGLGSSQGWGLLMKAKGYSDPPIEIFELLQFLLLSDGSDNNPIITIVTSHLPNMQPDNRFGFQ